MTTLGTSIRNAVLVLAFASLAGCIEPEAEDAMMSEFEDADDLADSDPNYLGSTVMQYEGSCNFLLNCSVYSRRAGVVSWGCGGTGCDMSERWVAVPDWRTYMCGEMVTVCRGDVCTTAKVKDVSCCDRWEASSAVLEDLGIDHASNASSCTGYGQGRVRIYRGARGGSGGGAPSSDTVYCASAGGSCGGNEPCWASCTAGTSCDFASGSWGTCQ